MNKTFFFLFFPLVAFGQRYTVLDTAYTVNTGGIFFYMHDITYSTGEQTTFKTLVGDTATYFNSNFDRFQDEAKRMAIMAQGVFDLDKKLKDLKKERDKILAASGKDVLDTIAARNAVLFTDSGWKVRDTSATNVTFSINASGQLRYQIQGQTIRNADLFGDAIILSNYKSTGNDVVLFKTESGNYRNREGDILLRKPGGAQNRAEKQPDFEAETIKLEPVLSPESKNKKSTKKKTKQ